MTPLKAPGSAPAPAPPPRPLPRPPRPLLRPASLVTPFPPWIPLSFSPFFSPNPSPYLSSKSPAPHKSGRRCFLHQTWDGVRGGV